MQSKPGRRGAADRSYVLPPVDQPIGPVAAVWLRKLRAADRGAMIIVWTLLCMGVQALMLVLPGRGKVVFPRLYWGVFGRLIGLRIRVIGTPATRTLYRRPVVFVANHSSWLDVAVIGATLETCFVSKDAVRDWPGINLVAKLGRTAYVTRQRSRTGRESDVIRQRLDMGDNIMLFPEGTTDDGARVMPFRSSFLSIAEGVAPPVVQAVSIAYDRLAGLPVGRGRRALFAYYGTMNIGTHFWRLVQCHGFAATILLHPPVDPRDYPDRKALTKALYAQVNEGAAMLRQGRRPGALPLDPAGA
jgi:1-acyl-sn-glycerol-3-phosphate acyltransferase